MEISRDQTAEVAGTTSIRLRYSRQFQNGGHAHTIDAEAQLAVGASPERREQIIRELEAGVDQLAHQITQRGSRPTTTEVQSSQAPARPNGIPRAPEAPAPSPALPRSAAIAAQPTAPLPVSESMPAAPGTSKDRTITLPQFLSAIKKRWDMTASDAMNLLNVNSLTGLNYREAYNTLITLKDSSGGSGTPAPQTKAPQQTPVVEAPRQANRSTPTAPNSRPPASQAAPGTAPITRPPGSSMSRPEAPSASVITHEPRAATPTREGNSDFAGSSRAPIPIHLAEVRDVTPSYAFDEEDEEEEYELPREEASNVHLQAAQEKLDELRNLSGSDPARPERLTALSNVLSGQISEKQLEKLIKAVWNVPSKKRLKVPQVEALISWAKGADYFADEVESLLTLLDEEEG